MRRRDFVALFFGVTVAKPLVAQAQHELRRVGILTTDNTEPFLSTFKSALRRLGHVEGQNIEFEVRSANGNVGVLPKFANELVNLKPDVIVTVYTPAALAAKKATSTIPIVMAQAGDPVGNGLVTSLAHPGGNVTGLSGTADDLGAKLLEVFRDALPSLLRVAVLAKANDPFTSLYVRQIEMGGQALGISTQPFMTHGAADFAAAFSAIGKSGCDGIIIQNSLPAKPAVDLALVLRLPTISGAKVVPREGGLMSYGANFPDLWRRASEMVHQILQGAKPADIPVEQPTKYELVINRKTADKLGIKIPATILLRADEVIE